MLKINLLILLIIIPFVSFSQITMGDFIVGEKIYVPPSTLEDMIENVKNMSANNAPRKEIASWMAKVIDHRITNMNSAEYFFDTRNYTGEATPLFDEFSDRNIYENETIAKWAWNNYMGNCEENSNLVYYVLNQSGIPKDFRQLATPKHQFTVWGLVPGADTSNPDTWGPNAIVIDPWLGYTLDSDGVKSNKYYQNGDPRILPADVTTSYDRGAKEWVIVTSPDKSLGKQQSLAGCWNLITGRYISTITVIQISDVYYQGNLTVNNLEGYNNNQTMFVVSRTSNDSFGGTEYIWSNPDNSGNRQSMKIPMKITINSDGNLLTWTSDETVTMQRCN